MIGYELKLIEEVHFRTLHGKSLVQIIPSERLNVSRLNLFFLTLKHRLVFIRYDKDFDCCDSKSKWWHVIKDVPEEMQSLPPKMRNQIRNGMKNYKTSILHKKDVILEGYLVYVNSYARYATTERMYSREEFEKAIDALPMEAEFIGVRELLTDELVGFSENFVHNKCAVYVTMWLDPRHMQKYAGYVLIHEMNKLYLNDRKFSYVSDGCRSLGHDTRIHDFLINKFLFRKAYSKIELVYFPGVYWIICLANIFQKYIEPMKGAFFYKLNLLISQERCGKNR